MEALEAVVRPSWRGLIHRVAAPLLFVAFVVLAIVTPSEHGNRLAVVVYGIGVTAMLTLSAAYHWNRPPGRVTEILRRVDHGTILLAIVGTYTAVTALAVSGERRGQLLFAIWVIAVVGIVVLTVNLHAPRWVTAILYLLVGWFAAFDLPAYLKGTTAAEFTWVVVGGLLYTGGSVVYALKRPDPWPTRFGFHEVFHALTVGGAIAHYVAVALLVSRL